ncbi:MAG: hypothetical protein GY855_08545 [candidate division Zixibacteria bacterium]|nr:hypothetical protein [candidate division Zixibacteria bacterium]
MDTNAILVVACHHSGTEMISDCVYNGGVLMGDEALLNHNNSFSVPLFAKWVLKSGSSYGVNPVLKTKVIGSYAVRSLKDYLKSKDDSYLLPILKPREDRRLTFINTYILSAEGYNWHSPSEVDCLDPGVEQLAETLIGEYSKKSMFWGLKDPRMVFTFNFWERQFEKAGINPRIVFIYRNPLAVAIGTSLDGGKVTRKEWPIERGLKLWIEYNTQLLKVMEKPYPSIVLKYEDFCKNDESVDLLESFLNSPEKMTNPFDPSRCHAQSNDIPDACREIYDTLEMKKEESIQSLLMTV